MHKGPTHYNVAKSSLKVLDHLKLKFPSHKVFKNVIKIGCYDKILFSSFEATNYTVQHKKKLKEKMS